jgi:hypothetical protein
VMALQRHEVARMRRGWRAVEVLETAPSGVPELPRLVDLKVNAEKTMRMIDALPAPLRAMVYARDWPAVQQAYPEIVRQAWWAAAKDNWGRR